MKVGSSKDIRLRYGLGTAEVEEKIGFTTLSVPKE